METRNDSSEIVYVKERLQSIQETEKRLVSFLSNFAEFIDKVHDTHLELLEKRQKKAAGTEHRANGIGFHDDDGDDLMDDDDDEEDEEDEENENTEAGVLDSEPVKEIIDKCYDDLSFASIHLRRELKLLDLKLPLPPNLSKKASDVNNEKLKQLLQD